jgi:hypothetical protein
VRVRFFPVWPGEFCYVMGSVEIFFGCQFDFYYVMGSGKKFFLSVYYSGCGVEQPHDVAHIFYNKWAGIVNCH